MPTAYVALPPPCRGATRFPEARGMRLTTITAAACAATLAFASTAQAQDPISDAVAAQELAPAVENPDVTIAGGDVSVEGVELGLPAHGAGDETSGETTVFDGTARATQIAVQPTDEG